MLQDKAYYNLMHMHVFLNGQQDRMYMDVIGPPSLNILLINK